MRPAAPTSDTEERALRWAALVVGSLSSFLTPFMLSSVTIALPTIGREFKADAVVLSWVATSYILAAAVSLVPFGKLADIHGRKRVHLFGMAVFTVTSALAGLSWSAEMLIVLRVFQGFGIAMVFATGIAILTSVFPAAERGRVLGITVAAVYSGLSCGPFIGGWLTEHLSWRSIFLINAALGAPVIVLILWKLKGEWAGARGEPFDLRGALVYAAAVCATMYGISRLPDPRGAALIAAGLCAGALFVWWELRVPHPVFEVRLFRENRVFAFSCAAALVHYSATFGVTFLMSLYLQYVKGLSPQQAGLVLIAQPVMMAVFSPFAGRLSDRVEPRVIASLGMGITALGLVLMAGATAKSHLGLIIACLMALGFGFALFSSPNMNAIMSAVDKRHYGIASGSVGTMRLLGQMLSMGVVTLLLTVFIGREALGPDNTHLLGRCVQAAMFVFTGLCGVGIVLSLQRGQLR